MVSKNMKSSCRDSDQPKSIVSIGASSSRRRRLFTCTKFAALAIVCTTLFGDCFVVAQLEPEDIKLPLSGHLDTPFCVPDTENPEQAGEWSCAEARWTPGNIFRDFGVEQRMDGTVEDEWDVRFVLAEMEHYYDMEVPLMPPDVRDRCKNSNELCAYWSSMGECEGNRLYMMKACPLACRLCWALGF